MKLNELKYMLSVIYINYIHNILYLVALSDEFRMYVINTKVREGQAHAPSSLNPQKSCKRSMWS